MVHVGSGKLKICERRLKIMARENKVIPFCDLLFTLQLMSTILVIQLKYKKN